MAKANGSKQKPVHEIKLGRIKGIVWANETEGGAIRHNVQIVRLYKEQDQWRDSTSFGRDDLPLVAKLSDRIHTWIFEHAGEGNAT